MEVPPTRVTMMKKMRYTTCTAVCTKWWKPSEKRPKRIVFILDQDFHSGELLGYLNIFFLLATNSIKWLFRHVWSSRAVKGIRFFRNGQGGVSSFNVDVTAETMGCNENTCFHISNLNLNSAQGKVWFMLYLTSATEFCWTTSYTFLSCCKCC